MFLRDKLPEAMPGEEIDEVGRALLRAARIIEERGWCQEDYGHRGGGPVCVMGAIMAARSDWGIAEMERLEKIIGDTWIERWNDHPSRTKEQVIAALESAARWRP